MALEVKNLYKSYETKVALNDISFHVDNGEILGIVGHKGAGKTTILKNIMGIISAQKGSITYEGQEIDGRNASIGYLSDEKGLYENLSIKDQLAYFSAINGLPIEGTVKRINDMLEDFYISDYANTKVKNLPNNIRKRVELITAIIHNPKILILDELFSGVDIANYELFKEKLLELKKKGSIIIFTSHKIEDIEGICDRVIILKNGEILVDSTVDELKEQYLSNNTMMIKTTENIKPIFKKVGIDAMEMDYLEYKFSYENPEELMSLNKEIANAEIEIVELKHIENSLKQVFVKELED